MRQYVATSCKPSCRAEGRGGEEGTVRRQGGEFAEGWMQAGGAHARGLQRQRQASPAGPTSQLEAPSLHTK